MTGNGHKINGSSGETRRGANEEMKVGLLCYLTLDRHQSGPKN